MKIKQFILHTILAMIVSSCLVSCLKQEGYHCDQYLKTDNNINQISTINFHNKKDFEAFKGDSVKLNDSTLIYWECSISK